MCAGSRELPNSIETESQPRSEEKVEHAPGQVEAPAKSEKHSQESKSKENGNRPESERLTATELTDVRPEPPLKAAAATLVKTFLLLSPLACRKGILMMVFNMCQCNAWQHWNSWTMPLKVQA